MNVADQVDLAANALYNDKGGAYTAGFLTSQLGEAVALLPKTKQKLFLNALNRAVGGVVKVKVKSLMPGQEVEIPWDQLGGPCDPSTERYWSM
jgi:hypothetical protein